MVIYMELMIYFHKPFLEYFFYSFFYRCLTDLKNANDFSLDDFLAEILANVTSLTELSVTGLGNLIGL